MTRLSIILVFFFYSFSAIGQQVLIRDIKTKKDLEFVTIYSQQLNKLEISDEHGVADISEFEGADYLEFRLYGYKTETISLQKLQADGFEVFLSPSMVFLQQAVVSATKWRQDRQEIPSKITSISTEDRQLFNPQTAADMLGTSGEVFIQKSQLGGGSPMIRGFSTNRLLYSVDGVRMNTAIFRSGNLQNVISLDPFALENTEIFFGPGSIIYGSDAIGAVMSFQTLEAELVKANEKKIQGSATLRGNTANNERTGHLHVKYGGQKWAGVSSFSRYNFGDLQMGSRGPEEFLRQSYVVSSNGVDEVVNNPNPRIQVPTGYQQSNLMQKLRFSPNDSWDFQYAFHYSGTSDFPRFDRLIRVRPDGTPNSAEWKYGPQIWRMHHLKINHKSESRVFDQMTLSLSQQFFEESRIDRNFNNPIRRSRVEKVHAYAGNLDFMKEFSIREAKVFYGLEGIINDVQSNAENQNIFSGEVSQGASRYPNSTWSTYALYATYQQRLSSKVLMQSGIRYSRFSLAADFSQNMDFYPLPFERSNNQEGAFNGSLGWVFTPSPSWTLHANFSTGFRAPNVDDIGKVFDSEPGAVMVPNPNLKAEYAYNVELNAGKIISESVLVDFTTYYTRLDNALVRRNASLNGQDSIIYDGVLSNVLALQNAAFVEIIGMQASIEVKFNPFWAFTTNLNIQKGTEETEDGSRYPSRHAPPTFGAGRLTYQKNDLRIQLYSEFSGSFSFEQLPLEERGKPELYAIDANGNPYSPSWATLNLKAFYELNSTFSFGGGLENITNVRYRTYSSGIAAPGRNFILSFNVQF